MTISRVSGQAGKAYGDDATSVSRAFPSDVTAGNLVYFVAAKWNASNTASFASGDLTKASGTATITDVQLHVVHQVDTNAVLDYITVGVWSARVTGTGSLTLQVGSGVSGTYLLGISDELSSTVGWDSSRQETTNVGGSATNAQTAASSGNVSSAGAAAIIGAVTVFTTSAVTLNEDVAFTSVAEELDGSLHQPGEAIIRLVSSATTDAADWTLSSNNEGWAAVAVALKEASAGGPVALTGQGATTGVGTATPTTSKAATGLAATGAAGTQTPSASLALSGTVGSTAVGSLSPSSGSQATLTGVTAAGAVGNASETFVLNLSGASASTETGSLAPQTATLTVGSRRRRLGTHPSIRLSNLGAFRRRPAHTATAPSVTAAISGVEASGQIGDVAESITVGVTGASAVAATGLLESSTRVREGSRRRAGGVHPGPGPYNIGRFFRMRRHTESVQTAAQAISGVSGAAAVGSVVETRVHALTGVAASAATGNVGAAQAGSASITAVSATSSVGTLSTSTAPALTGVSTAGSVGSVQPVIGVVAALTGVQCVTDVSNALAQMQKGLSGTAASGTIGSVSGSTPGTWTPVNTRTSSESWNPFAG